MTELIDNRAKVVKCYLPEYTFVEKLQAISTKVSQKIENSEFEVNFLRHFYDVYQLFKQDRVKKIIAFNFDSNPELFELYKKNFLKTQPYIIMGHHPLMIFMPR